jgi:hypothetical protein
MKKRNRFKNYALKLAAILTPVFIFIASTSYINKTYSWLADNKDVQMSAAVTKAEDFITIEEVKNEPPDQLGLIPAYIKVIKNCNENLNVSFELNGDVARFLVPIAPITISNKENYIPINVIANDNNYYAINNVLKGKNDVMLTGAISIRCFNGFINESRNINISARYLLLKTQQQINYNRPK